MSRGQDQPWVEQVGPGVGELTWSDDAWWSDGDAVARVSAACERAFAQGTHRVQARIPEGRRDQRRVLQRAALRPEGLARGGASDEHGQPMDALVLARLSDDPPPGSREAFLAVLNASLPLKRVIAQGLVRDDQDRVLLCALTYKQDWDLPGGVVDPHESPAEGLARELREELGLDLAVGRLLVVDWLPPYRQWDDALLCVFDLGVRPDLAAQSTVERAEIAALHWVGEAALSEQMAPYAVRVVRQSLRVARSGVGTAYLHDGEPTLAAGPATDPATDPAADPEPRPETGAGTARRPEGVIMGR